MSIELLGKGLSVDFGLNSMGEIKMSSYEKSVEESIYIILSTKTGERVYNSEFGCRIHELMFEPNNVRTQSMAKRYVEDALKEFEPRIKTLNVDVFSPDEKSININIEYEIINTNVVNNYVYPFYIVPSELSESSVGN
ncbi:MAG: GPW/gp25 family protein [Campylobacteraceae bacterium]|nr:GPW/gp25 family protein [Campylobacteraceae bacterium]